MNYLKRNELLSLKISGDTLVGQAYSEQQKLSLPWYTRAQELKTALNCLEQKSPNLARIALENKFDQLWISDVPLYSKISFYSMVKRKNPLKPFLLLNDFQKRKAVAQLRSSNHRLNNETGRYVPRKQNANFQRVKVSGEGVDTLAESFVYLPFFEPIIEYEQHFLASCSLTDTKITKNGPFLRMVHSWSFI